MSAQFTEVHAQVVAIALASMGKGLLDRGAQSPLEAQEEISQCLDLWDETLTALSEIIASSCGSYLAINIIETINRELEYYDNQR
jgi:hypothetical protein